MWHVGRELADLGWLVGSPAVPEARTSVSHATFSDCPSSCYPEGLAANYTVESLKRHAERQGSADGAPPFFLAVGLVRVEPRVSACVTCTLALSRSGPI